MTDINDEREALVSDYLDEHGHHADAEHGFRAGLAAALRRQGPITDDWQYGVERSSGKGLPYLQYDLASALRFIENPPLGVVRYEDDSFVVVRRRKAGPWEPFEAARDA